MIYRLVLVDIDYEGRHRPWVSGFRQPTITQVNRRIRKDTLPMFFANNLFTLQVPSPHPDLDHDHVKEEHRWIRFVRGLKLVAACGYPPVVRHLTIMYTDRDSDSRKGLGMFSTDTGVEMIIECFRTKYKTPNYKDIARKMGISEESLEATWDLMMGTKIGTEETDWNDYDAIDEALGIAIGDVATKLGDRGYHHAADKVRDMTVGRLVEALHALLQGRGSGAGYMALSVADRTTHVG